jgi:arylsulfatase A-like enzyme
MAWWPGRIAAGTVTDELAIGMDLLPTIADLAHTEIPADRKIDGTSLKDLLFGKAGLAKRHLFWGYEDRGTVMRDDNWKFITSSKGHELYDLNIDPGETNNLAESYPGRVEAMSRAVAQWRREVHAQPSIRPR